MVPAVGNVIYENVLAGGIFVLPDLQAAKGLAITFKNFSTGGMVIQGGATPNQTIQGFASITAMAGSTEAITLVSNGFSYVIVSESGADGSIVDTATGNPVY
jgi:hypothetical protein